MKKTLVLAFLGLMAVFVLFGCVNPTPTPTPSASASPTPMASINPNVVQAGDLVTLDYTTWVDDKLFDSTNKTINSASKGPIQVIAGKSQLIRGFDKQLIGLNRFDDVNLTIQPSMAYGEYDKNKIKVVELIDFTTIDTVSDVIVGAKIQNETTGEVGAVIAVNDTSATIDFNHELAGKTLVLNVKILSIAKPQLASDSNNQQ